MRESNPDYIGTMRGRWSMEGKASIAVLTLTFDKKNLAPFVANLQFVNEELIAKGERYTPAKTKGAINTPPYALQSLCFG